MAEKVVSLQGVPIKPRFEPDENAVAAVRDLLGLVESGEVKGVAIANVYADGTFGWSTGGQYTYFGTVGVLERLKSKIIAAIDQ